MKDILKRLDRVLDEEKRCLLDGELSQLEAIIQAKSQLADAISTQGKLPSKTAALYIEKKLKRNEALLKSARRGLKSAMTHLHEVAENPFQSYSKDGLRTPLSKRQRMHQNF